MLWKLLCPHCLEQFELPANSPPGRALGRLADQGPWQALGDGQTFEDAVYATLETEGGVRCPACGEVVPLSEETLGQLTLELLSQW